MKTKKIKTELDEIAKTPKRKWKEPKPYYYNEGKDILEWTKNVYLQPGESAILRQKVMLPRTRLQKLHDWLFGIKRRKVWRTYKKTN